MSTTTLYSLSVEGLEIERELIEAEGELTPELEARIDALLVQGEDKMDAAAFVDRRLKALSDECRVEEKRLAQRRQSFETAREHLRRRMLFALQAAFSGKLKTAKNTFFVSHSAARQAFSCDNLERLEREDSDFVKITRELDTAMVKDWLKAGGELPSLIAVTQVEGTEFLGIR